MKLLEDRIHLEGRVLGNDILKVDRFLTHQIDYKLMKAIGKRFADVFADSGVTKVITIEASGIAPAIYAAEALDVPMVFAKKAKNITMNDELLTTEVYSFTKKMTSTVQISKKFIEENDKVLIIDDFLANGQAALGLIKLMEQANSEVVGLGMVIEKSFQDGRKQLLDKGLKLVSLARIEKFEKGEVVFAKADDSSFDE
ncbi:xanthine phosphoribosyltransferase [Lactococcus allomyrinae]|uniref:Xanthine phosphoribosyltransferase n=1 Tax=Lactococcus allomyrinae TaxID=2419773 RepID=A0A387BFY5_9LACT|nr:xanthine phosphoribosyltransferase [Lactococcus allomyrinae]AYG00329.1 xanthine phosphoribosyltransferase [Lactococcus allomyrinae]